MALVDLFVLFCFIVGAVGAVLVAIHPNVLHAAIALAFTLLSVAGLYATLGADFLAGVQLIIYVGAVIIVILFAIMMSENIYKARLRENLRKILIPFLISTVGAIVLLKLLLRQHWELGAGTFPEKTTAAMGHALVGPYALPFQYVAIVLLSGLIGATVVARPDYSKFRKKK